MDVDLTALHVDVDASRSRAVALDWMRLGLAHVPLQLESAADQGLLPAVRRIVRREAVGRPHVVVIVPEFDLGRWSQALLHRSTGRQITRQLHDLRGVSTVVVPYPTVPAARSALDRSRR